MITFIKEIANNVVTSFLSIGVKDVIEIVILTILIFAIIMLLKNTRAWAVIKGGVIIIVAIVLIAKIFQLDVLLYLVNGVTDVIIIAIIVILTPEIRRGLESLGKKNRWLFGLINGDHATADEELLRKVEEETVRACFAMSQGRTGALICFEGEDTLSDIANTGIILDAEISSQLLENIFEHNTPLHDGAVIVKNGRAQAATCYLPLSNSPINKRYGTRHRAALGLSETSDALVVIVSEETGFVSVAQRGVIKANLNEGELRRALAEFLKKDEKKSRKKAKNGGNTDVNA